MMRNMMIVMVLVLMVVLGGCGGDLAWPELNNSPQPDPVATQRVRPVAASPVAPIAPVATAPVGSDAGHLAQEVVQPQTGEVQNKGAVQEAVAWMKKYAETSEKLVESEKQAMKYQEENRELRSQLSAMKAKIGQYERELHDANKEILAATNALEKWKTKVLGIQQGNDRAHKAQLQALHNILKILGAESVQPTETQGGASANK